MSGVQNGPSPLWMQRRLTLAGMRPIDLIVDTSNYVMLELGQPMHAFDRDRLQGPVGVRHARDGETLPAAQQFLADTVNVGPGQRYDVIWRARKPGTWLIHCHIPHHTTNNNTEQDGGGGLMMKIVVEG